MIRVVVLSSGFDSPNGAAFLFPLIKFSKVIRDFGISIQICKSISDLPTDMDYLLIDGKYYKSRWMLDADSVLTEISSFSSRTHVIWCDQTDSSGTLLGDVVPLVHKYAKAQLIVDQVEYLRPHYGARLYCDYYHKTYGVTDSTPYYSQPIRNVADLSKLVLSWNSGLMHYGWLRPYLMVVYQKFNYASVLKFSSRFTSPFQDRKLDFCCRMGIPYSRESVCFQRQRIRALLAEKLPTNKLSRYAYLQEMKNSKITLSPFGFGEITLKDFECFLAGSALVKPDMSAFETWPNFYQKGITYAPHSWDAVDVLEVVGRLLEYPDRVVAIAQSGQEVYRKYTCSSEAPSLFAKHFLDILK